MGSSCSKTSATVNLMSGAPVGNKQGAASNNNNNIQIEEEIKAAKLEAKKLVKILFLGGPSSGKSTLFKQVQILYLDGFSAGEMVSYASLIRANAVTALQQLIQAATDFGLADKLQEQTLEDQAQFKTFALSSTKDDLTMTPHIGNVMEKLWQADEIQAAYTRRREFQLLDSAKYFLDDIERISQEPFLPTPQDVLYSRSQTVGIHEVMVPFRRLKLRMIDVGGQKAEQRKWIHQFDDVSAVLFVVDLSGYCAQGTEDEDTNRVVESARIFERSMNNKFLAKASVILFMNKVDLFEEDLKTVPLKDAFEDYSGGDTVEEAGGFILQQMLDTLSENRGNYHHFTTATDTENIKKILNSTMEIIVQSAVNRLGLQ